MSTDLSKTTFYGELRDGLPTSTGADRKKWAEAIIKKDLDIRDLTGLLKGEQKVATRFLWLLSDIGIADPNRLLKALPFLLDLSDRCSQIPKTSFASLWYITGVPPENEGRAIDLLFDWLISAQVNVTTRSRSLVTLYRLTKKYPELKNELKICLTEQMYKHSKDFDKRASRILDAIAP